ncbi:hypothetical protein ACLKA7_005730 [Drosophila subpalustris]
MCFLLRTACFHWAAPAGSSVLSCNETDFTTLQEKLYSHQQNKQQKDPGSGPGVPTLPEMTTSPSSPSQFLPAENYRYPLI